MTDIVSWNKDYHRIEHLGLTLADSKQLLKLIQKKLLQQQIDPYLETHSQCPDCDAPLKAKDYTNRSFRTLFGTLAVHRGEPLTGIVYLRPGGRPPVQVRADVQALMDAEIDWTPSVIVVYRAGCLRLRRLSEGDESRCGVFPEVTCPILAGLHLR